MALYPGPEGGGLAEVHVHRAGVLQLIYNGEAGATDLTFPELKTGETLMVDTEYGMQELEARDAKGARRNLWPLMKLARSPSPIPAGEVTIVRFLTTKGIRETTTVGHSPAVPGGAAVSRELYAQYQREAAEDRETYGHPRAQVRFWSKTLELWGPCGDFRDLRFTTRSCRRAG
ncbi:hypothetical protein GS416_11745 [Rhodococcus hoagii]|nr:hypothetical protein [Prescottella equi]